MQKMVVLHLKDEAATLELASLVAKYAVCGDFIRLDGTLGMGKTTFARQFIRTLAGDNNLSVPSPTFNLMQTYTETRLSVAHVDAYRLSDPIELEMLDLDAFFEHGVVVMEWAENVEEVLPTFTPPARHIMESEVGDKLQVVLQESVHGGREVHLIAEGTWLKRFGLIVDGYMRTQSEEGRAAFLKDYGIYADAIEPVTPDCSFRTYYRVATNEGSRILMDAPPPLEELEPFVHMANYYQSIGVHAPKVYEVDLENGYALLEDLGSHPISKVCADENKQEEILTQAVDLLIHVANQVPANVWKYDASTTWQEAKRFTDWYLPTVLNHATDVADRAAFKQAWFASFSALDKLPKTTCHMDFHVDNILLKGDGSLAVIDFQDARVGPVCMDLACLLEDRFPAGDDLKEKLIRRFLAGLNHQVSYDDFMAGYNLCVAHRFFKITGLLHRLEIRDGRNGATARMEQVWKTLEKALQAPACAKILKVVDKIHPQRESKF